MSGTGTAALKGNRDFENIEVAKLVVQLKDSGHAFASRGCRSPQIPDKRHVVQDKADPNASSSSLRNAQASSDEPCWRSRSGRGKFLCRQYRTERATHRHENRGRHHILERLRDHSSAHRSLILLVGGFCELVATSRPVFSNAELFYCPQRLAHFQNDHTRAERVIYSKLLMRRGQVTIMASCRVSFGPEEVGCDFANSGQCAHRAHWRFGINRWSQPWVYRLTLQCKNAEDALVSEPQRFLSNETLQAFYTQGKLTACQ